MSIVKLSRQDLNILSCHMATKLWHEKNWSLGFRYFIRLVEIIDFKTSLRFFFSSPLLVIIYSIEKCFHFTMALEDPSSSIG
jgi:hypothetical protein